ncbi:MAG: hypothetical protein AABW73_01440 [Nanoarchaeota archaeon]
MINPDIIRYFKEGIWKGYTQEFLKQNLLKNGYDINEVEETERELIRQVSLEPKIGKFEGYIKKNWKKIMLAGIILLAIIIAATTINWKGNNEEDLIINENITMITCDGTKNQLLVEPGQEISYLQITNAQEQQLRDLNQNRLIETSYTINIPLEKATIIKQEYYLITDPSEANGTSTNQVSKNKTQFLTLSNISGIEEGNDKLGKMIKTWQNRSISTYEEFEVNTIYINLGNQSRIISYTCNTE